MWYLEKNTRNVNNRILHQIAISKDQGNMLFYIASNPGGYVKTQSKAS